MNTFSLKAMVALGVPGFKCFLIHSGVDEFPAVTKDQVITFNNFISSTNFKTSASHIEMFRLERLWLK